MCNIHWDWEWNMWTIRLTNCNDYTSFSFPIGAMELIRYWELKKYSVIQGDIFFDGEEEPLVFHFNKIWLTDNHVA